LNLGSLLCVYRVYPEKTAKVNPLSVSLNFLLFDLSEILIQSCGD
jgi:hypothetical protein